MPSLKSIRKRIVSVKSTQKITRAMKMVAGARLNRAQQRITELRPFAIKTKQVLLDVTAEARRVHLGLVTGAVSDAPVPEEVLSTPSDTKPIHPLLAESQERSVQLVVFTSDRGLCGSFNATICKLAESEWRRRVAEGQRVQLVVIGRKGRDYFRRRNAPMEFIEWAWDDVSMVGAQKLGRILLAPFLKAADPVDALYFIYNEFKSAMTQTLTCERLLPVDTSVQTRATAAGAGGHGPSTGGVSDDETPLSTLRYEFHPDEVTLLKELAPMYVQLAVFRAMLESIASELGARMTAMESATNNASDMIARLTLQYNRARQAAITKELMEIIGGSEALKG